MDNIIKEAEEFKDFKWAEATDEQITQAFDLLIGDRFKKAVEAGVIDEKIQKAIDDGLNEAYKRMQDKADFLNAKAVTGINSNEPGKAAKGAFLLLRQPIGKWFSAMVRKDYPAMRKAVEEHDELVKKYNLGNVVMGKHLMMSPDELRDFNVKASTSASETGLVPETYVPVLIDRLHELSRLRQLATVIPVPSSSGKLPRVDSGLTGYGRNEAVAPTESNIGSSSISYATEEISAYTEVSAKLIVDAMPINLLQYLIDSVVEAVVLKEYNMFITANNAANEWKNGLDNETFQEVSVAKPFINGWIQAASVLGGDNDISLWEPSLVWVVKRITPGLVIVNGATDNGYLPSELINMKQCLGYDWIFNSAIADTEGYLFAMNQYLIVEVPALTKMGAERGGAYAVSDSVAIYMHTSTDGLVSTNGRAAAAGAGVKLTNVPTSFGT